MTVRDQPDTIAATLRRIAPLAMRYRWTLLLCSFLTLFAGTMQLILPLGVRRLFDDLNRHHDGSALATVTMVLVSIFIVRSAVSFFAQYYTQTVGERITCEMRFRLLEHYMFLPRRYHLTNPSTEIITYMYSDAAEVRNILTMHGINLVSFAIQITGAVVIMTLMNVKLAMVVIALGPTSTVVTLRYGKRLHAVGRDIKQKLVDAMAFAQEYVFSSYVVKIFDHDGRGLDVFRRRLQSHFALAVRARRLDASKSSIIMLLTALSTIGVFWYGGTLVQAGEISTGALVAFFLYSQSVSQDIGSLAATSSSLLQATGAVSKLFAFLDEPEEAAGNASGLEFKAATASLEFEQVSFAYKPGQPVLDNFNLTVPAGTTVLARGRSGAGKTTLLSLIARYNDPQSGRILLNGIDIREYSVSSLRRSISIVAQDVILFSTSIMENIRFGNPSASDEEVIAAAKVANAHEFIVKLRDGYDTFVGERATQLSGGQRQRISIARAMVRQAPILILDEATSAVDEASAIQITEALNRIKAGRTTFVVSHREINQLSVDRSVDLDPPDSFAEIECASVMTGEVACG
jgi:subfamily B ATP-binding cassette protein MsbA